MASERVEVKVGQVWEDCDKRSYGRKIRVIGVEDGKYALCEVLHSCRFTRLAIRRMRPTSTGWRLISDGE